MPSNPETCITYSCPNSTSTPLDEYFQQTKWGSNINNSCMKPLADAEVSKQYRCDERWYDWFTVPNYHLGNGYINPDPSNPGTCYNPCLPGSIPTYQTDPVDGQNLHFISNTENTGNCISRENYFGGKYASGSDYCPLAWIYILNSTHKDLDSFLSDFSANFEGDQRFQIIYYIKENKKNHATADNLEFELFRVLNSLAVSKDELFAKLNFLMISLDQNPFLLNLFD